MNKEEKKKYDEKRYTKKKDQIAEYAKQYYVDNKEKICERTNEYRKKNLDYYKDYHKEYNLVHGKALRVKNRDKMSFSKKKSMLKKKFGLSIEQYEDILLKQDGVCAICFRPELSSNRISGRPDSLCVDHNHKTGKMRGLLCRRCNRSIGLFDDSPELLIQAFRYLMEHTAC